jgi:hypothetical protein
MAVVCLSRTSEFMEFIETYILRNNSFRIGNELKAMAASMTLSSKCEVLRGIVH